MRLTSRRAPRLNVIEVTTDAQFTELRAAWNSLVERIDGHVFLRHEWFHAAWAWRRIRASLCILCVYDGERLVGLLPLIIHDGPPHPGRRLEYLSVPDSQWCDVLVEPDQGADVAAALIGHLRARQLRWDWLAIERLPERSAAHAWLGPALAGSGLSARVEFHDSNPFVDLRLPWADYLASLSRSIKKTRNLAANRLARAGAVEIEWVTSSNTSSQQLEQALEKTVAISARSWKRGTGTSLEEGGPNAFIRELTRAAHAQGWLSLWLLHLNGTPVAMEYQLIHRGTVYALRSDFDESHRALCTGTYLNFHILERLFAEPPQGAAPRYCMGPGNNPYKLRWSSDALASYAVICYSTTMRGRAQALWSEMKPTLRALRDRVAR